MTLPEMWTYFFSVECVETQLTALCENPCTQSLLYSFISLNRFGGHVCIPEPLSVCETEQTPTSTDELIRCLEGEVCGQRRLEASQMRGRWMSVRCNHSILYAPVHYSKMKAKVRPAPQL